MIDAGDYDLERSGQPPVTPAPRRSANAVAWAAVVLIAVAGAGGIWYFTSRKQPSSPSPAATVPAAPPATVPPRPEGPLVKAADIDLPPLPLTDPIVRELVARLSSHPTIAAWLATDRLIENFTVVMIAIAEGRTPAPLLRSIAPRGRFGIAGAGEELMVDPRSYERYTPHAEAIAALDSAGTASLYLTLEPRITDAYLALGHPEGDFDRVLERAIGLLLQTPVLDEKVALHRKSVTYAYDDPRLESLPAAQKQLLRMGPRNAQAIRAKLEEIAALLRLQPERP